MRIHSLQHVSFEDVGSLKENILTENHSLTTTHWYKGETAPHLDTFDVLIVMGGPMGVYDEAKYPWLVAEKTFLKSCIKKGKKIIGICLGAQLIACVMGAKVSKNSHREIGWFPLTINAAESNHPISRRLKSCSHVFHWHGDTFELPAHAKLLASSEACTHQAFAIDENILGFQFHLEATVQSAQALITHCGEELDNSRFVQSAKSIMQATDSFTEINNVMSDIWEYFLTR